MSKQQTPLIVKVRPPKIDFVWLENYSLADIQNDFELADFERKISHEHVNKMLNSILNNKFYDIVISATKPEKAGGRKKIFDGQHRITALVKARDLHGLKTYSLMLALYPAEEARDIYVANNSGKRLVAGDLTKALDTGNVPLFNGLRQYLFHYRNKERMAFTDILYAIYYAKSAKSEGIMGKLKELIDGVSTGDISKTRLFLEFITTEYPGSIRNPIYKMTIFRNILRIGFEKNYSEHDQYVRLCKAILKNKAIMANSDKRHREQTYEVYDIIQKQILPKL